MEFEAPTVEQAPNEIEEQEGPLLSKDEAPQEDEDSTFWGRHD